MKTIEKIFSFIYGIMGWCTWVGVIGLLVFVVTLFCIGDEQQPTTTLSAPVISEVTEIDDTMTQNGVTDPNGWYKAEYTAAVTGAKLSPYSYTANEVKLQSTSTENRIDGFLTYEGDISYSATNPCEFKIIVYAKKTADTDTDELTSIFNSLSFVLSDMHTTFGLLDYEKSNGTPMFAVSKEQGARSSEASQNVSALY